MLTIIMNDLNIFIFPFIVGFAIRFGVGKWSKAFLVTVFFTLLALAAIWAEKTIPSHGSEIYAKNRKPHGVEFGFSLEMEDIDEQQ